MSLQRWVEGKVLQPSRGSSRVCGQGIFIQLHALVWQYSRGEGHLMPWGRSQTSAPHPLAWQTQRQEPSRCEQPHSQPGTLDCTVQALLSHPPAPQPAPFPKLRQPFLHVTFQSLQVTVLSSKAQEYLSSFGGCSSLDVLMCTSCNMSTCPLL